jgi:hypothetical protein
LPSLNLMVQQFLSKWINGQKNRIRWQEDIQAVTR